MGNYLITQTNTLTTMSERAPDVPMADASQPKRTRSSNAPPRLPPSASEATKSLASMLDDVQPPERLWTFHERSGVIYHAEETRCDECAAYIMHLQDAKQREDPSLLKTLRELESAWLKRLDDHPATKERLNVAYRDGIAVGVRRERHEKSEEGRAREDSGKGKGRASQAEEDLEALQKKYEDLVRANAVLVAEKRVAEQENASLLTQIRTLEREFGRLSHGTGAPFISEDRDVLMEPAAVPSTSATGSTSGSYAAAAKRKPAAPSEGPGPSKRQRPAPMTFRDPRTNLPVPMHPGGNPHFDNGAWHEAVRTCPGENLDQKIRWLCQNRHLSLFKRVIGELREFVHIGGVRSLGPHQKFVWKAKDSPWSLRELALVNPEKAHPGVRWDGDVPNESDLATWSLVRCLYAGKPEVPGRRNALRDALALAVEDLDLWGASGTQSLGLNPMPLPSTEAATPDAVARHLSSCGVTRDFVTSTLRPFVQRAQAIITRSSIGSSPQDADHVIRQLAVSTATSAAASVVASADSPVRDADMAEAGLPP
jgi:hypothetical protein